MSVGCQLGKKSYGKPLLLVSDNTVQIWVSRPSRRIAPSGANWETLVGGCSWSTISLAQRRTVGCPQVTHLLGDVRPDNVPHQLLEVGQLLAIRSIVPPRDPYGLEVGPHAGTGDQPGVVQVEAHGVLGSRRVVHRRWRFPVLVDVRFNDVPIRASPSLEPGSSRWCVIFCTVIIRYTSKVFSTKFMELGAQRVAQRRRTL